MFGFGGATGKSGSETEHFHGVSCYFLYDCISCIAVIRAFGNIGSAGFLDSLAAVGLKGRSRERLGTLFITPVEEWIHSVTVSTS